MATDTSTASRVILMQRQILKIAEQLAAEGAHYLWGANGDIPGAPNSPLTLAPTVWSTDPTQNLAFCAAWNQIGGQVFVCTGRCRAMSSWNDPEVWSPESDGRLATFIANNKDKSPYHWGTDLTPRRVRGSGEGEPVDYTLAAKTKKLAKTDPAVQQLPDTDSRKTGHLNGVVVFGEGCDETRHFDCYGFVNWVVKVACGVTITRGTRIPALKDPAGNPVGAYLDASDPGQPADIIAYPGHIAFAIEPGVASGGSTTYRLAQAESGVYGVTYGKPRSDPPAYRVRLSDATLLNFH